MVKITESGIFPESQTRKLVRSLRTVSVNFLLTCRVALQERRKKWNKGSWSCVAPALLRKIRMQ